MLNTPEAPDAASASAPEPTDLTDADLETITGGSHAGADKGAC